MLAKIWKRVLLIILIIACLFNIINKLTKIVSFDSTIKAAQKVIQNIGKKEEKIEDKKTTKTNNNINVSNQVIIIE